MIPSAVPDNTGSYNVIKTVVVLVMENRSFDHMLGWMKPLNPEIDGVDGTEYNLLSTSDPNSQRLVFGDKAACVDPDPGHTLVDIYEQLYGSKYVDGEPSTPAIIPRMNGFAQQAERQTKGMSATVMNGFSPDAIPVYKELVAEFAICDRWFSSVPSETQPNRLFVHSATSNGMVTNDNTLMLEGLPQRTIFDNLDDQGKSFGIYSHGTPATILYKSLRKLKFIRNFHSYELEFKQHCKEGNLPNYTVIEPRYFDLATLPGNDDHPSHDISEGQKLVKETYEALRSSPQWNEMLFIIVYDEHGGFFDHVPPPFGCPSPDGHSGPAPSNFHFDRLGVRVPAFFISPWIERGIGIYYQLLFFQYDF